MSSDTALPPNYRDFPDGSILRVVFDNFLTYDHTSFVPTANLNMILGHNGSGKSSIICGICLACGGTPKSLGRSGKIHEYIRHGCQEGYVELALADKLKGPQTIRLTIRIGKAPEYRLNDKITTQSELKKLCKHYNIQIDNPCAFLAQDKVKSFSEQSAEELLKNTEKAASETLLLKHEQIAEKRKDFATIEEKCTTSEKTVKHLETEIQNLEPFVDNYQKKVALQMRLCLLEKKSKYMEFEVANERYQRELRTMDDVMEEYTEEERNLENIEQKQKVLEKRIDDGNKEISSWDLDTTADSNSFLHYDMGTEIEKEKRKWTAKKEEAILHENEIERMKNGFESVKMKLATVREELVGYEDALAENKKLERELEASERECRQQEDVIQRENYALRTFQNKAQMENSESSRVFTQRMRAVQTISADTARAYNWYRQNRSQFRGAIYMPLIDMVLKTPEAAKVLENSLAVRDLPMLVCQYKDDERLLHSRDENWRINTSVVSQHEINPIDIEATLPDDLRRLGFKSLAVETFDAPPELKQYLCNMAGMNMLPIGDADVESNLSQVSEHMANTGYSFFMTHSLKCKMSRSRYSGEVIQTQTALHEPMHWTDPIFRKSAHMKTHGEMNEEIRKKRTEIELLTRKLRERRFDMQRAREQTRVSMCDWKAKKQSELKLKSQLEDIEVQLRSLQGKKIDVKAFEDEYKAAVEAIKRNTTALFLKRMDNLKLKQQKLRHFGVLKIVEKSARRQIAELTVEAETVRKNLENVKAMKKVMEDVLPESLTRKKVATEELKKFCQLKHLDVNKMEPGEKDIFDKLHKMFEDANVPNYAGALDREITTEKTRLKMAEDSGQDGSIEHVHKIENLKIDLREEQSKHEELLENRRKIQEELGVEIKKWSDEVSGMINEVNVNYVKYFEELGCRGEVSLETPENPLDIEKYGIMIMVSFRAGEPMKRLDNKVQSGGERSVATMLYLLALQQLCPVPFRCIDEINQGMDPTNERKVFDIMVGLWNGSNGKLSKTQYFLLSPKLLHGLNLRENVNVILVNSTLSDHHGKFFDTSSKLEATLRKLQQ